MRKYIVTILLLVNSSCVTDNNKIIKKKYRTTENSILNYEDTARQLTVESINEHFLLNIEIEAPYVIKTTKIKLDDIYSVSNIGGISIFEVSINKNGKILSRKILKKAGFEFDKLAEKILSKIKISPAYKIGVSKATKIIVKIEFAGVNKI